MSFHVNKIDSIKVKLLDVLLKKFRRIDKSIVQNVLVNIIPKRERLIFTPLFVYMNQSYRVVVNEKRNF